ncbi:hypothetical protein EPUS_08771 [Endocarpon pusillum Z07020]|uniref:ABC transporter domain-containing protein n=1 Tax=Endocarpon pusillum (strain Z07020 / HMAS-L-300199) TaxID=1263415 RepID=U1HIC9_ENDPU|nr:uncharacterized protein EPUS_08771 [Endocarpon pusillum Z07020]ERF69960.1 hypothetical protein EPUS_08771 [Endocarpon pusillum Z07020]
MLCDANPSHAIAIRDPNPLSDAPFAMGFIRQTWTLTVKNLLIVFVRRWFSTILRALVLPVAFMFFISYVRNFFLPPSTYGFGSPRPIRNLTTDVFGPSTAGRNRIAFINNGYVGGQIESLISRLSTPLIEAGVDVQVLSQDEELTRVCRSSLRGTSSCYAAASFESSPTEGDGGVWNYTVRADSSLGFTIFVDRDDNAQQIHSLPFLHAIDAGIASLSGMDFPETMNEYPFTSQTRQERDDDIQVLYMGALIDFLAVTFFVGICGITYHLAGHMASERELGMSQLIDAMTANRHHLQTQATRLFSTHLAFDIIYLPGWIVMGLIVSIYVFPRTSSAIIIPFHVLTGISLSGYSILGGSLFRKAQLSGITITITSIVFAVIAQVAGPSTSATAAVLSFIFPPMNYTLFIIYMARWERQLQPTNLTEGAPESPWQLTGSIFFACLAVQIVVFPVLGALVERSLYGTASRARKITFDSPHKLDAIKLVDFSKRYKPSWWYRNVVSLFGEQQRTVNAVNGLSLTALRGQVVTLLGANGSGKSTTLDAVSGLNTVTSGSILVDGTGGLGLCPQKNVLWDELTVYEHVAIFNGLKAPTKPDSKAQIRQLVKACDLENKFDKKSKTLSGGQRRKLQLAMTFTGGSRVCCVDEVSSGLDPLSRRKIWDILLAERGVRTFLFTTHALDEADVLSDHIVILSKGNLKAQGSAVELKHRYGGGYRVHVRDVSKVASSPEFDPLPRKVLPDETIFRLADSAGAARFIDKLEKQGVQDYQMNGPTIEDAFLGLAEEGKQDLLEPEDPVLGAQAPAEVSKGGPPISTSSSDAQNEKAPLYLLRGKGSSLAWQTWTLFRKRARIFSRNYFPYFCAVVIPIATAGLVTFFLTGFEGLTCRLGELANNPRVATLPRLEYFWGIMIPAGSSGRFTRELLPVQYRPYADRLRRVDTFNKFQVFVRDNFRDVVPGGVYLGDNLDDTPLLAYRANGGLYFSALAKTVFDSFLMNTTIVTQFSTFALPIASSTGDTLQLTLYFGLAMSVYPGFFALYPTVERLNNVRALHYSNGVRAGPLWLAYILFDVMFVLVVSAVTIAIFVAVFDLWYAPSYMFVTFFLYGLSSTLLAYVVSLFARSQLAAFAFTAGGQAIFLLIHFIILPERLLSDLNVVQFTYGLITPSGNLLRVLLLSLNQSQLLCRDQSLVGYPGDITVYGGPILYLTLQSMAFFTFLVWYDSGYKPELLTRAKIYVSDEEREAERRDEEVFTEVERTENSSDGLRVLHLTKAFGSNTVVEDVTFGVKHGEVFSLLGPNGAGKSTAISLIRGDIRPSSNKGDVLVEGISISRHRAAARGYLGVCPQFDAMDHMTVLEHLRFYANACGVPDVEHNAAQVIAAVGLEPFKNRMAGKLSGGNKRKLSLGIAIMGNPSVLLLDEPSSGMDAIAKRVMWKMLNAVKSGRSLVITTHSMEEADALADRAGILAKKMLALGTSDYLRRRYGDGYHIHLVHRQGPHAMREEMEALRHWVLTKIPRAVADDTMLHGQFKFRLPNTYRIHESQEKQSSNSMAWLLALLEDHKDELNIEYYSVTQTTLEQVFLSIVGKHRIEEEENLRATQGVTKFDRVAAELKNFVRR